MERTIRISGRANKKVKADYVTLNISLNEKNKNQTKAIDTANQKVALLNEKVIQLGFKKEDLKLSGFEVNPEYRWQDNKQVFDGFVASYRFVLEFDFESDRLLKAINQLTGKELNTTIDTSFRVKDEEAVKQQILSDLTKDAFVKAKSLANAANVVLGQLISMDYEYAVEQFVSPTSYRLRKNSMMDECCSSVEFTPADVTVEDSAVFVWEIK